MAENETRVTFRGVANFTDVIRGVDRLKKKFQELRREEAQTNAASVSGANAAASARGKHVGALTEEGKAAEALARGMDKASAANNRHAASANASSKASRDAASGATSFASAVERGAQAASRAETSTSRFVKGAEKIKPTFRSGGSELNRFQGIVGQATNRLQVLQRNLDKLRDWRPRLIPPFIALVPVIGSLLALVNPLVAGLGALGPVAFGFAGSLGSLTAAALGAAPALAGLLSTVLAIRTAFSGVGKAFKLFGKTPAGGGASGGGGGGSSQANKQIEITQTEKITRAQEQYRRSIQDVTFAEEDLDDARKDYIKRVQDLQKAVDRAAASQARAAANSRLAQENYANVLADPGSTKGQKMDAAAQITDAQNEYKDVVEENKQNAKDLADLKKTGINGDRQVIQAQRAVTDAVNSQRDAQIALQNAIKGTTDATSGGGGAASAADQYAAALAKLSPSARKFVEQIVAMKGEFDKLKKTVQEAFFSQFVDDINLLYRLFPPVTSLLSDMASSAGRLADKFLKLVTNDEWVSDIAQFGKEAAPIFDDLGDAVLYLLDGFRNLTLALTPFLQDVATKFKDFSKDLRNTLAAARKDGSLAKYMQTVERRWSQWWRVIKNVGKTIFNYSAATADFGQWLTDGLEKLTEGWVKNSEDARKQGSGYQQYLEDLKPLLKEVKGLFGDFFNYLHDEATDPDNIKLFTDIVKIIREDVGPALGDILDALSKSGIGEGLAKAVGSILEAIATFLENGGAEGMSAFFDTMAGLAKAAGDFVGALPRPVVKFLTESFAILAALTFVGLNLLIGNLIRLGASKGLFSILKLLSGGKVKGWGDIFGGLGKGGKGGSSGGSSSGSSGSGDIFLGGEGKSKAGRLGAAAGKGERSAAIAAERAAAREAGALGRLSGGLGRAGKALAIFAGLEAVFKGAGSVAKNIGSFVSNLKPYILGSDGAGVLGRRAGSAAASTGGLSASKGSGIAGLLGKGAKNISTLGKEAGPAAKVLKGIGTAGKVLGKGVGGVGSIVGAVAGTAISATAPEGKAGGTQRVAGNIVAGAATGAGIGATVGSAVPVIGTAVGGAVGGAIGGAAGFFTSDSEDKKQFLDDLKTFFTKDVPNFFKSLGSSIWDGLTTFGQWLSDTWEAAAQWLRNLPETLAYAVGALWANIQNFGDWLVEAWNNSVDWIKGLPQRIANTAQDIWRFIKGLPKWFAETWNNAVNWIKGLPKRIADTAGNVWRSLKAFGGWLSDKWGDAKAWVQSLPKRISDAAGDVWRNLGSIGGWLAAQGDKVKNWAQNLASSIGNWVGDLGSAATKGYKDNRKKKNSGGIIRRAGGGSVPGHGNGDTVPAMLTPGEFVTRKSIVDRIGVENFQRLNAGVMSFSQMLSKAQQERPGRNGTSDMSFFNGGGLVPQLSGASSAKMSAVASQQPQVANDYSMHFGDIIVNNPVAEKSSDSLPKAIRRGASLGSIRRNKGND